MKTDNELIAEFMGGKWETVYIGGLPEKQFRLPDQHITEGFTNFNTHTFYDTSWDWLMPVVEKIREYTIAYPDQVKQVTSLTIGVKQSTVYSEIVSFIKWYNQQKI